MKERVRKVKKEQLEKMTDSQIKQIEEKLGEKLRGLIDNTVLEANKLLDIYGLQVKMQFLVEEKDQQ